MQKVRGLPIPSLPHTAALAFMLCLGILMAPLNRALAAVEQVAPGGGGRMPQILLSPNTGTVPNTDPALNYEDIVLVANDMGVVFRSTDSGETFTQIDTPTNKDNLHHLQMNNGADVSYAKPWAWTLSTSSKPTPIIFAGGRFGFYKSIDQGQNWEKIPIDGRSTNDPGPYYVAFNPKDTTRGITVFYNAALKTSTIYATYDTGDTWAILSDADNMTLTGHVKGVFFDEAAEQPMTFFLATAHNVYRHFYFYDNDLHSGSFQWKTVEEGLPLNLTSPDLINPSIRHLSGISRSGAFIAYLTYNRTSEADPPFYQLVRSGSEPYTWAWQSVGTDTWQIAEDGTLQKVTNGLPRTRQGDIPFSFYDYIDISKSKPWTAYVTYEGGLAGGLPGSTSGSDGGIFKTVDGGKTWSEVLFIHKDHKYFNVYDDNNKENHSWLSENSWIWCQKAETVFVSPTDPDANTVFTSSTGLFKSTDGGAHWSSRAALNLQTVPYYNNLKMATPKEGIPVLAVRDYFIAPGDNRRHHFLSTSDFSLFHSSNWGNTWILEPIKMNNVYRVATDPAGITDPAGTNGRLWAVGGGVHGLPGLKGLEDAYSSTTTQATYAYTTDYFGTTLNSYTSKITGSNGTTPLNATTVDIFIADKSYDESSPQPVETWYIAALGRDGGVYKSMDTDHKIWSLIDPDFWTSQVSTGKTRNRNVIRVGKILGTDTLFALTTACGVFAEIFDCTKGRGLYFLVDGHWILQQDFKYATDIEFLDKDTYYVSEWSLDKNQRGGVWEHKPGTPWTKTFKGFGVSNITLEPQQPQQSRKLYLSVTDVNAQEEKNSAGIRNFKVYIMTVPSNDQSISDFWEDDKFTGLSPMRVQFNGNTIFYTTLGDGVIKVTH
jgi:hypothetical protein